MNFNKISIPLILDAKTKIDVLRREDSLIFPLFSDLHTPSVDHESVTLLIELLTAVTGQITCDAVIDLGDNADMLGRISHITNDELNIFFKILLQKIHSVCQAPLICVPGNHDAIGTDFFDAAYWNKITKHQFCNTSAAYDKKGAYYYVDFIRANTRLVVLSVPSKSDIMSEYPKPIWRFGIDQLRWLENTALHTNKYVLIFIHAPFFSEYRGNHTSMLDVWTGERSAVSYISELCGRIEEASEASAILNRFAKESGRLLACFSGHIHSDSLRQAFEDSDGYKNPIACPQSVTRSFFHNSYRTKSTSDQYGFAMDILVCTPSTPRIDLIRIGDGQDRRIL